MSEYLFKDCHVRLPQYVQEAPDIGDYLDMMGESIQRSVLLGLPLQEHCSHAEIGDVLPTYCMPTDAPPCYYFERERDPAGGSVARLDLTYAVAVA